jgi:L-iditol 2-dehydrogenase
MKALLLSEYKRLEIADLPKPVPGPGEILLRVAACGICGSDVHGYDGSTGRRIPPIVMGHEAAGTVTGLGEGAAGFSEGDRVTFDSTVYCGRCAYCLRGLVNLCDHRQVMGVSTPDFRCHGAFAEYVAVPSHIVYRLPDQLSFVHAAMLEAVSVALHAVSFSKAGESGTVLVIGAGMIGLLTLQGLRAEGFPRVFIADLDDSRLRLAARLGAAATFHASGPDLVAQVLAATEGQGVDLAIECVGRDETVRGAVDSVRKGGAVTLVGNIRPEVTLPLQKVVSRQIRLQGSAASAGEYTRAIELLGNGAIQVEPLITAVAPLEDGPRWFERLYAGEPNLMKVVLTPESSHV